MFHLNENGKWLYSHCLCMMCLSMSVVQESIMAHCLQLNQVQGPHPCWRWNDYTKTSSTALFHLQRQCQFIWGKNLIEATPYRATISKHFCDPMITWHIWYGTSKKTLFVCQKIVQPIQFPPSFCSAPENCALLEHFHKGALMVSRGTEEPSPQTETFHRPTGKEQNSQEENIKSEIHTERQQVGA